MVGESNTLNRNEILRQVVEGGKIAGPVAGLFGFVADVLNPLAPLNGLLFIASAIFCGVLGYQCRQHRRRDTLDLSRRIPEQALIFGMFLLLGSGIWFVLQMLAGSEGRGAVASNVKALARLQDAVFGLEQEVAEVKRGVAEVKKDTGAIKRDTTALVQNTAAIAQDTGAIKQRLDEIGEGGIINNPDSPADFYHNARFHELEGRYREAIASYGQYVEFDQEFVDPYLAYLDLLRAQRGQPAAQAEFGRLKAKCPNNRALELTALMLLAGQPKVQALEQFIVQYPDFGPAYLFGANAYSAAEMAIRSKVASGKEKEYLQAFLAMNEAGNVMPYYLDKRTAIELLGEAQGRMNAGAATGLQFTVSTMTESLAQFSINDLHVKQVFFKLDGLDWCPVPKQSIRPMQTPLGSMTVFTLPSDVVRPYRTDRLAEDPEAETLMQVKYVDTNDRESQVVTVGPLRVKKMLSMLVDVENMRNRMTRDFDDIKRDMEIDLGELGGTTEAKKEDKDDGDDEKRRPGSVRPPKVPEIDIPSFK